MKSTSRRSTKSSGKPSTRGQQTRTRRTPRMGGKGFQKTTLLSRRLIWRKNTSTKTSTRQLLLRQSMLTAMDCINQNSGISLTARNLGMMGILQSKICRRTKLSVQRSPRKRKRSFGMETRSNESWKRGNRGRRGENGSSTVQSKAYFCKRIVTSLSTQAGWKRGEIVVPVFRNTLPGYLVLNG